jgi:hypothetical protein
VRYALPVTPVSAIKRLDGLARFVAGAREGNRNAALNWAAFCAGELVRENRVSKNDVFKTLSVVATSSGLEPDEIPTTIASGLRAGIEKCGFPIGSARA